MGQDLKRAETILRDNPHLRKLIPGYQYWYNQYRTAIAVSVITGGIGAAVIFGAVAGTGRWDEIVNNVRNYQSQFLKYMRESEFRAYFYAHVIIK
jgi:hypothetical protein